MMLTCLSTLIVLSLCTQGLSNCIEGLPSLNEVKSVAQENQDQLESHFRELWVFPSLSFSCNGSITKWRVAASTLRNGGGRPEISVWRESAENQYYKVGGELMDANIIEEGEEIVIHENVLVDSLDFQSGDILGLYLRREPITNVVPYLRNVTTAEGNLGYFEGTLQSPEEDTFTVTEERGRTLLPVLAVDITCESNCGAESSCVGSGQLCTSSTASPMPVATSSYPSPTTSPGGSDDDDINSSTSGSSLSTEQLILVIAVPSGVVILLLITALLALMSCWVRREKNNRRHHSIFPHADLDRRAAAPSSQEVVMEMDPYSKVQSPTYESIQPWPQVKEPPPPYSVQPDPLYEVIRPKQWTQ